MYQVSSADIECLETVQQLQDWIESFEGLAEIPVVAVKLTKYSSDISIGGVDVYSSEDGPDENETLFEHCQREFLNHIRNRAIFLGIQEPPHDPAQPKSDDGG